MKIVLLLGMTAAWLGLGCGDRSAPSAQPTNAPTKTATGAGNPLTAPVDYLGAVGAAHKRAAVFADVTTLQQAIQAFQAGEERLPANLQELVTEGYLPRLPSPPKGNQFAYNPRNGALTVVPSPAPAR